MLFSPRAAMIAGPALDAPPSHGLICRQFESPDRRDIVNKNMTAGEAAKLQRFLRTKLNPALTSRRPKRGGIDNFFVRREAS